MTDKTDETGKGPQRPGEAPRRPHATIDLKATEIGRQQAQSATPGGARPDARPTDGRPSALPPPGPSRTPPGLHERARRWAAGLAGMLGAGAAGALRLARDSSFMSHMGAGVAGAAVALAVAALLGLFAGHQGDIAPEVSRRLAAVESSLARQPASPPADAAARLAAVDARVARLEEQAKTIAALDSAQAKLVADAKALEARIAGPELAERIGRLETALAALSAEDKGEAGEAKSASARLERELAALKSDAAGLRQGLEALKGSLDGRLREVAKAGELAPLLARLAALEREVGAVVKTEGDRVTNAHRVLMTLELANLKRALDRGDSYTRELDAVRKAAGGAVDLEPLERSSRTGVATLGALTQDFKRVAYAATDAETERTDASVLDRLMAGAKSIVRLRKAHHDAEDTSAEATLGRMESALKDGNLGEVLAQGRRLPPKAAQAAEDWLRKVEARYAADRSVASLEASLKASLSAQPAEPEPKR